MDKSLKYRRKRNESFFVRAIKLDEGYRGNIVENNYRRSDAPVPSFAEKRGENDVPFLLSPYFRPVIPRLVSIVFDTVPINAAKSVHSLVIAVFSCLDLTETNPARGTSMEHSEKERSNFESQFRHEAEADFLERAYFNRCNNR